MLDKNYHPSKARISRSAIQRLYIAMRHLFIRGSYKPLGVSGEAMIESLKALEPEIYGSMNHSERVELDGLLYIFQRLPQGIERCRYIKLISREGFESSEFDPIIPSKRRRNCYRIDQETMFIEMTRGQSDIYDILTHLTFMYIEAEKIRTNSLDSKKRNSRAWEMLKKIVHQIEVGEEFNKEVAFTYLSTILGRSYKDIASACSSFANAEKVNSLFTITYWLGQLSIQEFIEDNDREITFSSLLRDRLGHHIYGELWANNIKTSLYEKGLMGRPTHVISANLHSVKNSLFATSALKSKVGFDDLEDLAGILSQEGKNKFGKEVTNLSKKKGLIELSDDSGVNLNVQIIDCSFLDPKHLPDEVKSKTKKEFQKDAVIIVMDYAFGEQAYETMDELLKPYEFEGKSIPMTIESINIMGKAGILTGKKGDIMIPTAHVFEGRGDNYPFENDLCIADFEHSPLEIFEGPMITVLGTSLQNRDILEYFVKSSWKAIGLEMEGAHYQKAIQAASKIRKSVNPDIKLRYAYYASDNPLETGSTLASGALGLDGVKPTYLITTEFLKRILFQ